MRALGLALAIGLLPIAAAAQTSQGPMIVEEVHNGFLVAPDFKFTEVDHRSSGLAGGYAGFVFDEHFFIGGGGYVLATDRRGRDLAYGGLMLQWLDGGGGAFGYGAKLLLGGGQSESSGTVQVLDRGRMLSQPFRASQGFFVAEPGMDARIRLAPHLRLAVGAGYRFTGIDRRHDPFFDLPGQTRLNGATGSIGLQIGGGS